MPINVEECSSEEKYLEAVTARRRAVRLGWRQLPKR